MSGFDLLPKQQQAFTKLLENKVGALFMKMGKGRPGTC